MMRSSSACSSGEKDGMRDDATRVDDAHLRARVAGFCHATHDAVSRKHMPVATSTQKSVTTRTMAVLGL
jgi:hypothetical protein